MARLHLLSPQGFRAAGVYAGIKSRNSPDIGLLVCETRATAAAVFTTNKVFAAPVKIGREHVADGKLRAVVVNSGNANACTGKQGDIDAFYMCEVAAELIGCTNEDILPSSTGIIGHRLPIDKVEHGIKDVYQYLGDSLEHAHLFADAILTTDLKRKAAAVEFKVGRQMVTIAGVCKGSGMIGPRMALPIIEKSAKRKSAKPLHATMLAYLTTDAKVPASMLRKLMGSASDASFNAVTVDDHTSTNDTAAILASGLGPAIDSARAAEAFTAALNEVCQSLAYQIAADGEGATKVVKVNVRGAVNKAAATAMARAIANSPLVKCAMHGNDPNWGRIVSAAGLAGVPFDPERSTLTLQNTVVFRHGQPVEFDDVKVSAALKSAQVIVDLACDMGKGDATVWTCDLSKEYVTINADYHT
ncbi:MAG TPA: bifunctional glutamate N-acetyltransferase/amino-acid acetyltransferase ArgJ [Tepidisphaeraceae bacterium]|jgi:glutamate N-acetyltransferase/amino-acid N-acetyltransferase|nr:bifunctional glutamate N-acetyltransferase/amino-acid acetyltransferase ArgJ [Tepidisphaeraceae bacterium]